MLREWGGRAVTEARAWTLARDGEQCRMCGSTEDLELDHVLPRSLYPDLAWDRDNWQILCKRCNLKKSNKTESKRKTWYHKDWLSSVS